MVLAQSDSSDTFHYNSPVPCKCIFQFVRPIRRRYCRLVMFAIVNLSIFQIKRLEMFISIGCHKQMMSDRCHVIDVLLHVSLNGYSKKMIYEISVDKDILLLYKILDCLKSVFLLQNMSFTASLYKHGT